MVAPLMNEVARDYVTDGVPSSGPHEIRKPDLRAWGAWVEQSIATFTNNGGFIYATRDALENDLSKDANTLAWVINDVVVANNAIYRKLGPSGSGSWVRSADLPYSFIVAQNGGTGTPSAIAATSSIPISGSALVLLNITETNTASPVTVSFNGQDPLTIKSNSGNDITIGGLQSGMLVMGRVAGPEFRLVSDQVSSSIIAQAEDVLADILTITGSFQPFAKIEAAVGSAIQSIDTGNADAIAEQVHLFIDGVYQFKSTWSITAGVITPLGGAWPGDGVVINAEVHHVPAFALEDVPLDGSVTRRKIAAGAVGENELDPAIMELINEGGSGGGEINLEFDGPFGATGLRMLITDKQYHYGFNSGILDAGGGKWVIVYRRASYHGVVNDSQIWAADSYDKGQTLLNHRLIFDEVSFDVRNFVPCQMANGRIGILLIRRAETTLTYGAAAFVYSDAGGSDVGQWQHVDIPKPAGVNGFNFHNSLLQFPASVGGHDEFGFMAFSYEGGKADRVSTTDNGSTWTVVANVLPVNGTFTAMSESAVFRVPGQNKWIAISRVGGPSAPVRFCAHKSTDALNWSGPYDTGLVMNLADTTGNPPAGMIVGDDVCFMTFSRRAREIATHWSNQLLCARANASDLFDADVSFTALGVTWQVVTPVPDWASGSLCPVMIDGKWFGTFACGEANDTHLYSQLALIGDFLPTGADSAGFAQELYENQYMRKKRMIFGNVEDPNSNSQVQIAVGGASYRALATYAPTSSSRTHVMFNNSNGTVGSIATNGSATAYNTTSDGRLKANQVEAEIFAGAIFDSLIVKEWDWLDASGQPTGERGFGLVAQDVYHLAPYVVTVGQGSPGDASFSPWAIDYSKLVLPLLAEVKALRARVATLEGEK